MHGRYRIWNTRSGRLRRTQRAYRDDERVFAAWNVYSGKEHHDHDRHGAWGRECRDVVLGI